MKEAWSDIASDVRYALRAFGKSPGSTAVILLTLALGLGATTAIFSVVNGVLLRPLPYGNPDRVVQIVENVPAAESPRGMPRRSSLNLEELDWWRMQSQTLSHVAAMVGQDAALTTPEGTVQLAGERVSPSLFPIRAVTPLLGRGLLPDEERANAEVVVLSEATWRQHLHSDPDLIGNTVELDGRPYTVVGVMPAAFGGEAFWTPFVPPPPEPGLRRTVPSTARLRDGVTLAEANAEASVFGAQLRGKAVPGAPPRFEIVRELDERTASVVAALRVLVVAVTAVLLIVCTNVANLLLARGAGRQQEIAIRRALGASRGRVARQVLTESLVLAVLGSLLGVGLAFGGVELLKAAATVTGGRFGVQAILPRNDEIAIDPTVLLFAVALAVATALLFGVLPALRLSRFGERGRRSEGQLAAAPGGSRLGSVLATVQLAFAMALLVGAGLLLNSFVRLAAVDPGVDTRGVLTFDVMVPNDYTPERRLQAAEDVVARLRANPKTANVGFTDIPPLTPNLTWVVTGFVPEGMTQEEFAALNDGTGLPQANQTRMASTDYLRALGARLVGGRWLDDRDAQGPMTVLVTRPFAQRFLAGRDAVGATLVTSFGPVTVAGVVDDLHLQGVDIEAQRAVFFEPRRLLTAMRAAGRPNVNDVFLKIGSNGVPFAVRASGDPLAVLADVRSAVRSVDPALTVDHVQPLAQVLSGLLARPRFYAALLGVFGAIAGFIAVIGIYGVLAYLVGQRTKEIGVRMALGARSSAVVRLVLRRGAAMVAIGIAAGLAGAAGLTRYLEGMLYGLGTLDAGTYAAVAAVFAAAALFASWLPARRAARIDPMRALREE